MKVLLIDNKTLFREGLQNLLQSYGIAAVQVALTEADALAKARTTRPDVIMINISGSVPDRLETIRRLKAEDPAANIIAFADSHDNLLGAMQMGASGYLLSDVEWHGLMQEFHKLEQSEFSDRK